MKYFRKALILFFFCYFKASSVIYAQEYIIPLPSIREQGYWFEEMILKDNRVIVSGLDVAAYWQDTSISPSMLRYLEFDWSDGQIIQDTSIAENRNAAGRIIYTTPAFEVSWRIFDIDTLTGLVLVELLKVNSQLQILSCIDTVYIDFNPQYILWAPQLFHTSNGYALHWHGSNYFIKYDNLFNRLDSVLLTYPPSHQKLLTPMLTTMGSLVQGYSVDRSSWGPPFQAKTNAFLRKLNASGQTTDSVMIPRSPQYPITISPFYRSPQRIHSLQRLPSSRLLGVAEANTHNHPPYTANDQPAVTMSNQVVVFRINETLDSSSFVVSYLHDGQLPIYASDKNSASAVYDNFIYVIATLSHDLSEYRHALKPYWEATVTTAALFCLDSNLNIRWRSDIGEPNTNVHVGDIQATPDSGVVVLLHELNASFPFNMNARIIKINKNGISTNLAEEPTLKKAPLVYPNPAADLIYIKAEEALSFELVDLQGRSIQSGLLVPGENQVGLATTHKGIYLLRFADQQGKVSFQKLLVQ